MEEISSILLQLHKNFVCSVCLEVVIDPVFTQCNHKFCNQCILPVLKDKNGSYCPLCVTKISKRGLSKRQRFGDIARGIKRLFVAVKEDTGNIYSPPSSQYKPSQVPISRMSGADKGKENIGDPTDSTTVKYKQQNLENNGNLNAFDFVESADATHAGIPSSWIPSNHNLKKTNNKSYSRPKLSSRLKKKDEASPVTAESKVEEWLKQPNICGDISNQLQLEVYPFPNQTPDDKAGDQSEFDSSPSFHNEFAASSSISKESDEEIKEDNVVKSDGIKFNYSIEPGSLTQKSIQSTPNNIFVTPNIIDTVPKEELMDAMSPKQKSVDTKGKRNSLKLPSTQEQVKCLYDQIEAAENFDLVIGDKKGDRTLDSAPFVDQNDHDEKKEAANDDNEMTLPQNEFFELKHCSETERNYQKELTSTNFRKIRSRKKRKHSSKLQDVTNYFVSNSKWKTTKAMARDFNIKSKKLKFCSTKTEREKPINNNSFVTKDTSTNKNIASNQHLSNKDEEDPFHFIPSQPSGPEKGPNNLDKLESSVPSKNYLKRNDTSPKTTFERELKNSFKNGRATEVIEVQAIKNVSNAPKPDNFLLSDNKMSSKSQDLIKYTDSNTESDATVEILYSKEELMYESSPKDKGGCIRSPQKDTDDLPAIKFTPEHQIKSISLTDLKLDCLPNVSDAENQPLLTQISETCSTSDVDPPQLLGSNKTSLPTEVNSAPDNIGSKLKSNSSVDKNLTDIENLPVGSKEDLLRSNIGSHHASSPSASSSNKRKTFCLDIETQDLLQLSSKDNIDTLEQFSALDCEFNNKVDIRTDSHLAVESQQLKTVIQEQVKLCKHPCIECTIGNRDSVEQRETPVKLANRGFNLSIDLPKTLPRLCFGSGRRIQKRKLPRQVQFILKGKLESSLTDVPTSFSCLKCVCCFNIPTLCQDCLIESLKIPKSSSDNIESPKVYKSDSLKTNGILQPRDKSPSHHKAVQVNQSYLLGSVNFDKETQVENQIYGSNQLRPCKNCEKMEGEMPAFGHSIVKECREKAVQVELDQIKSMTSNSFSPNKTESKETSNNSPLKQAMQMKTRLTSTIVPLDFENMGSDDIVVATDDFSNKSSLKQPELVTIESTSVKVPSDSEYMMTNYSVCGNNDYLNNSPEKPQKQTKSGSITVKTQLSSSENITSNNVVPETLQNNTIMSLSLETPQTEVIPGTAASTTSKLKFRHVRIRPQDSNSTEASSEDEIVLKYGLQNILTVDKNLKQRNKISDNFGSDDRSKDALIQDFGDQSSFEKPQTGLNNESSNFSRQQTSNPIFFDAENEKQDLTNLYEGSNSDQDQFEKSSSGLKKGSNSTKKCKAQMPTDLGSKNKKGVHPSNSVDAAYKVETKLPFESNSNSVTEQQRCSDNKVAKKFNRCQRNFKKVSTSSKEKSPLLRRCQRRDSKTKEVKSQRIKDVLSSKNRPVITSSDESSYGELIMDKLLQSPIKPLPGKLSFDSDQVFISKSKGSGSSKDFTDVLHRQTCDSRRALQRYMSSSDEVSDSKSSKSKRRKLYTHRTKRIWSSSSSESDRAVNPSSSHSSHKRAKSNILSSDNESFPNKSSESIKKLKQIHSPLVSSFNAEFDVNEDSLTDSVREVTSPSHQEHPPVMSHQESNKQIIYTLSPIPDAPSQLMARNLSSQDNPQSSHSTNAAMESSQNSEFESHLNKRGSEATTCSMFSGISQLDTTDKVKNAEDKIKLELEELKKKMRNLQEQLKNNSKSHEITSESDSTHNLSEHRTDSNEELGDSDDSDDHHVNGSQDLFMSPPSLTPPLKSEACTEGEIHSRGNSNVDLITSSEIRGIFEEDF